MHLRNIITFTLFIATLIMTPSGGAAECARVNECNPRQYCVKGQPNYCGRSLLIMFDHVLLFDHRAVPVVCTTADALFIELQQAMLFG